MASEDITYCANYSCKKIKCERNPKNICKPIPHSFMFFTECPDWNEKGANWLTKQIDERSNNERIDRNNNR